MCVHVSMLICVNLLRHDCVSICLRIPYQDASLQQVLGIHVDSLFLRFGFRFSNAPRLQLTCLHDFMFTFFSSRHRLAVAHGHGCAHMIVNLPHLTDPPSPTVTDSRTRLWNSHRLLPMAPTFGSQWGSSGPLYDNNRCEAIRTSSSSCDNSCRVGAAVQMNMRVHMRTFPCWSRLIGMT